MAHDVLDIDLLQELDFEVGSLPIHVIDDGLLLFRRGGQHNYFRLTRGSHSSGPSYPREEPFSDRATFRQKMMGDLSLWSRSEGVYVAMDQSA
jgi:hypothetical protein